MCEILQVAPLGTGLDNVMHAMPYNPGYHKVGLGAWRVVLLRKGMEKSKDGDIIAVHCCNYLKCPDMKDFAASFREYVIAVMQHTDFFMPLHYSNSCFTPAEVMNLIANQCDRDKVANAPMGRARLIIVRVNEKTRNFVKMIEDLIKSNPLLLSPADKTAYQPAARPFGHATAEQSVLSVLAYREGFIPIQWRGTWAERLQHSGDRPAMGLAQVLGH